MRFDCNYTGQLTLNKEVYKDAVAKLVNSFKSRRREDRLGIVLFGRVFNLESFRPGSKLDRTMKLAFVYPDDVVLKKDRMRGLSDVLAETFASSEFPIDVFVGDAVTIADRRFCFIDSQDMLRELRFGHYFGARYEGLFHYSQPNSRQQQSLRDTLNTGRGSMALFDLYRKSRAIIPLFRGYRISLEAALRFPSMLLKADGRETANPADAMKVLFHEEKVPDQYMGDFERLAQISVAGLETSEFGVRELQRIRDIGLYINSVDSLLSEQADKLRDGLYSAVDFMECMVREYIKQQPQPSRQL